jgi:hypothetical protein
MSAGRRWRVSKYHDPRAQDVRALSTSARVRKATMTLLTRSVSASGRHAGNSREALVGLDHRAAGTPDRAHDSHPQEQVGRPNLVCDTT